MSSRPTAPPGTLDQRARELADTVREIQERVRARHPQGQLDGLSVPLPYLLPILHARDAAEGKVASIGSVNPRPPGLVNNLIQSVKRSISRALGWFVRDQVEFNQAVITYMQASLDAMNEANVTFQAIAGQLAELRRLPDELRNMMSAELRDVKDLSTHWEHWRQGWEQKLFATETSYLRALADLQGSFHHRVNLLDSSFRDVMKLQHKNFEASLDKAANEVQTKLWADLEKIRVEYEQIIHSELRMVRQRISLDAPTPGTAGLPATAAPAPSFDYSRFAEKFRGPEEYVRKEQEQYADVFRYCKNVLDIGCGRGEFLERMRGLQVSARGIDLSPESVALCRSKGLEAEIADLYSYLPSLEDESLGGVFCSQVVEHLPPDRLPEMIRLIAAKLVRGGVVAIETPNPECLAIFATHFYLDPTHTRPVPPALLAFYLEEFGIGRLETRRLSPAIESMPSVGELPEGFRQAFFGGLDYVIIGRKL